MNSLVMVKTGFDFRRVFELLKVRYDFTRLFALYINKIVMSDKVVGSKNYLQFYFKFNNYAQKDFTVRVPFGFLKGFMLYVFSLMFPYWFVLMQKSSRKQYFSFLVNYDYSGRGEVALYREDFVEYLRELDPFHTFNPYPLFTLDRTMVKIYKKCIMDCYFKIRIFSSRLPYEIIYMILEEYYYYIFQDKVFKENFSLKIQNKFKMFEYLSSQ